MQQRAICDVLGHGHTMLANETTIHTISHASLQDTVRPAWPADPRLTHTHTHSSSCVQRAVAVHLGVAKIAISRMRPCE